MLITSLIPDEMAQKSEIYEIEEASPASSKNVIGGGFAVESNELPKGYFSSLRFMGTFCAVGMNLMSSTGGFALIAPVLAQIDVALSPSGQPSPAITWLALVYTMGLQNGRSRSRVCDA